MGLTSTSLLVRLRQPNDSIAWERFVRLYTPLLLSWGKQQGFQDADAEELAQEVFIKVLPKMVTYQRAEGQTFRGWLFILAKNASVDFRRRKANQLLPAPDGLSGVSDDRTQAVGFEEAEYFQIACESLNLIRGDFNDTTWAAFEGVILQDRPAAEVAAKLKITLNAVYLARHRVLTRMRQELAGLLD